MVFEILHYVSATLSSFKLRAWRWPGDGDLTVWAAIVISSYMIITYNHMNVLSP